MVTTSCAMWRGQKIGIETIFTVDRTDGKRIYDPIKLKEVREKRKNGELYCEYC